MKENNEQALLLRKTITRLDRRVDKLSIDICDKKVELKNICIHNESTIKESYIEGGYYDKEQYVKTTICDVCGKQLNREVKYGGFC